MFKSIVIGAVVEPRQCPGAFLRAGTPSWHFFKI
jgi:hypothetical protein